MKARRVRSNRIVFTLNNYTEEEVQGIVSKCQEFYSNNCLDFAIVGKEVAPTTNTPHLQGFINLKTSFLKAKCGTPTKWRSLIPALGRSHMENAYGSDHQSEDYCSKEGDILIRLGTPSMKEVDLGQQLLNCETMEEVEQLDALNSIRYRFQMEKILQSKWMLSLTKPQKTVDTLLRWQVQVIEALLNQNNRAITWVTDPVGASGKTTLRDFLNFHLGDDLFWTTGGKNSDVVFSMLQRKKLFKYVIFDYPRKVTPQFYNWSLFEDFKNGDIVSGKYESAVLKFPSIKILVLGNHCLDDVRGNLTYDRWDVHHLSEQTDRTTLFDAKSELAGTVIYPQTPDEERVESILQMLCPFCEKTFLLCECQINLLGS